MDTYEFRGYDLRNKEMVQILTLDFDRSGQITEIDTETYCWFGTEWIPLMQYVGRKDKNEKKIFEKDIIKWSFTIGEYPNQTVREEIIVVPDIRSISQMGLLSDRWDFEVIGNTYEHPHLIPISQESPKTVGV